MKKKLLLVLGAGALTLVMSSCWALQSFTILDYTLTPGQVTKARFTLRPMDVGVKTTGRQFVIVGVDGLIPGDDTDIGVSNARWGTTGTFGGPYPMALQNTLITAMGMDCSASGLNFADISGVVWKAFTTPVNVNDRGRVEQKSVVEVNIKTKAAAVDATANYTIMGVAGQWNDDGDGIPEDSGSTDDFYTCWAIATSSVYAKA
jgi:hypothetical protein